MPTLRARSDREFSARTLRTRPIEAYHRFAPFWVKNPKAPGVSRGRIGGASFAARREFHPNVFVSSEKALNGVVRSKIYFRQWLRWRECDEPKNQMASGLPSSRQSEQAWSRLPVL